MIRGEIVINKKSKSSYKKSGYDRNTAAKEKKKFIEQLLKDAEENKRFPWHRDNISLAPKSLGVILKNQAVNKKGKYEVPEERAEYRGINRLTLTLAAMQHGYKDSRWVTFALMKKLGGHLKKHENPDEHEKAQTIYVFKPKGRYLTKFNPETGMEEIQYEKDKNGNYVKDEDGKKIPKIQMKNVEEYYKVFNVDQIEGLNLPPEKDFSDEISKQKQSEAMETILKNSEAKIYYDQDRSGESFYSKASDTIHLPERKMFKSLEGFYGTAAHEIAHSTGHEKRLKRDMTGTFGTPSYAKEELVAELTAVFLKQELGIQIPPKDYLNHEAYLKSWDQEINFLKAKPNEFFKVCTQAEEATRYIKEHMLEKELKKKETKEVKAEKEEVREIPKEKTAKGIHPRHSSKGMER